MVLRNSGGHHCRLFLLPDPLDVPANPLVRQQQLAGVIAPSQDLFIGDQVVDARVALLTKPKSALPHLLQCEPTAEALFAVAMARDEVMEREDSTGSFAQLASVVHSILVNRNPDRFRAPVRI
jgi:hypothetical protein